MAIFDSSPEESGRTEAEETEKAAFNALPLIDQNALKLAKLEDEWSTLGPLRPITFTVLVGEEGEWNSIARDARAEGFDVHMSKGETEYVRYQYTLKASRLMEPIAENC